MGAPDVLGSAASATLVNFVPLRVKLIKRKLNSCCLNESLGSVELDGAVGARTGDEAEASVGVAMLRSRSSEVALRALMNIPASRFQIGSKP